MAESLTLRVIEVIGQDGQIADSSWLAAAESVHRQLRPQLPAEYASKMTSMASGGARMVVCAAGDLVLGVSVYRCYETTFDGLRFYVDDLVTDAQARSRGVGKTMLDWLKLRAKELGCNTFTLESGTQREAAHKFYFREGMTIKSFSFRSSLQSITSS